MSAERATPLFDTMAVIGVGLIGGSLGMAAKMLNLARRVVGYGRNRANLEDAINLNAIDVIADTPQECVESANIVFVCTPVRTIIPVLREIAPHLQEDAILTDVGSTKRMVVEQASRVIPKGCHFIGGHPMAGTEESGVKHAFPELFRKATYILTPEEDTDVIALSKLSAFVDAIGARCEIMGPEDHDNAVAVISHLPHIMAASLLGLAEQSNKSTHSTFRLAAGSFRDLTRIADSPPEIWRDICLTNADMICGTVDEYIIWLERFKSALMECDEQQIQQLFETTRQIRQTYIRMSK